MRSLLLLLVLAACTPPEEEVVLGPFHASDAALLGPDGRSMLLRGINARVDGIFDVTFDDGRQELEPIPPFVGADCAAVADLGLNLLRLPVNWSAIEPDRRDYQDSYADRVRDVIAACHAQGVFTLVDLHQDAYSKHIGEDGAPLWAIVPPPDELLEGPLHDLAERRTSTQVLRSFRTFFDNEQGLMDDFAAMVAWLAGQLDGAEGLVGVEIFNEPVAFDDEALHALHTGVADAVRDVAPDLPLAFEPDALRNFTDTDPVAFAGPFDNAIYAPHHYTDIFTDGWASANVADLEASVAGIAQEARSHRAHPLVGEFGADLDSPTGRQWFEESLRLYDEHTLSWALWLYEEWSQDAWGLYDFIEGDDGPERAGFRDDMADLIARPYPQAIEGELTSFSWDADAATLTVELDGRGTHTVAAPSRVWPQGPTATCDGEAVDAVPAGRGRVDVLCEGAALVLSP